MSTWQKINFVIICLTIIHLYIRRPSQLITLLCDVHVYKGTLSVLCRKVRGVKVQKINDNEGFMSRYVIIMHIFSTSILLYKRTYIYYTCAYLLEILKVFLKEHK